MNLFKLIFKEISYRKTNFLLSVLSVTIAVSVPLVFSNLIKSYKVQRDRLFELTFKKKEKMLKDAENKYRIATKKFGYNVLILPKNQNVEDFYADDYASKTMPESYVRKLANSGILTVRHFLPSLKQKIRWPEGKRTIIIFGTSGEIRNSFKKPREPMMMPIKPGEAALGYLIHKNMKLNVGDRIKILGKQFSVVKLLSQHGNKDDITIWLNLKDAQEILDKKGRINAILALQCVCSGGDFNLIRDEISKILPDTQTLGIDVRKIKSRAEIRAVAAKLTKLALANELQTRQKQIETLQKFMNIIVPIIILASALWISFLAMSNVKARRYEIGLLMALGMRYRTILFIFLAKAFVFGMLGATLGYFSNVIIGVLFSYASFNIVSFIAILIVASLLTIFASFPPTIIAVTVQPADILRSEK